MKHSRVMNHWKTFLAENATAGETYTIPLTPAEEKHFQVALELNALLATKFRDVRTPLVGGACRDLMARLFLQGRSAIHDLDFAIYHEGGGGFTQPELQIVAQYIEAEAGYTVVDEIKFFHLKVVTPEKYEVEYTSTRREAYRDTSRKPETTIGTVDDDVNRRDFTINAIYLNIVNVEDGKVTVSPAGSRTAQHIEDLKQRVLRTTTDPQQVFSDDPLRIMRGARFAGYGYNMHPELRKAIDEFPSEEITKKVSVERIADELSKILLKGDIDYLIKGRFINKIIPEFAEFDGKDHAEDTLQHIADVVRQARALAPKDDKKTLVFLLAALMHDVGKAQTGNWSADKGRWTYNGHEQVSEQMTQAILRRLKFPADIIKRAQQIVGLHMKIKFLKTLPLPKIVEFILTNTGQGKEDLLQDLLLFNQMDWGGKPEAWRKMMDVDTQQAQLTELLGDLVPRIQQIQQEHHGELSAIGKKIGENPRIPNDQKQSMVMGTKVQYIVRQLKSGNT